MICTFQYKIMATIEGIDHSTRTIHLTIAPSNVPTLICRDNCTTNLKACQLAAERYGIQSPVASCSSHAASGTVRSTTTSTTMSDLDAVLLYNSLRKILKHFSMSPKSNELLNNSLNVLEQNDIHMLVWGGTRMARFLDACRQSSAIFVYFLDINCWKNLRRWSCLHPQCQMTLHIGIIFWPALNRCKPVSSLSRQWSCIKSRDRWCGSPHCWKTNSTYTANTQGWQNLQQLAPGQE